MPPQKRRSTQVPVANVIVQNISPRTLEDDLRKVFKSCNQNIADVYVPADRMTGENQGYAVIRFYNTDAALNAIDALDGCRMDGYVLQLHLGKLPKCLSAGM